MRSKLSPSAPTLVLALAVAGALTYLWRGADVAAGEARDDGTTEPPAPTRGEPRSGARGASPQPSADRSGSTSNAEDNEEFEETDDAEEATR